MRLSLPAHTKRHLATLRRVSHHPDHYVVGGAHHGLPVHRHDLVPGEQAAVQVRGAARYNVTDRNLKQRALVTRLIVRVCGATASPP